MAAAKLFRIQSPEIAWGSAAFSVHLLTFFSEIMGGLFYQTSRLSIEFVGLVSNR